MKVNSGNSIAVILRSALGGTLGGFFLLLLSVFEYKFSLGYIPYPQLFLIEGLPLALGVGALAGAAVGGGILILRTMTGKEFGFAGRAVVGFIIILIAL